MLLHLLYAPQGQYKREVSFSLQFCLLSLVNLVCYSRALEEIFEKLACPFFFMLSLFQHIWINVSFSLSDRKAGRVKTSSVNKFRFTEEWFGDIPKDVYVFGYAKVCVDLSENESKIKEVSNRASNVLILVAGLIMLYGKL